MLIFCQNRFYIMDFESISWITSLPSICILGSITNLMNIIVFRSIKCKTIIQKYNLCSSVLAFFYMFLCIFQSATQCKKINSALCKSIASKNYELYSGQFFVSSIAVTLIFIQIYVSILHYLQISGKTSLLFKYNTGYVFKLRLFKLIRYFCVFNYLICKFKNNTKFVDILSHWTFPLFTRYIHLQNHSLQSRHLKWRIHVGHYGGFNHKNILFFYCDCAELYFIYRSPKFQRFDIYQIQKQSCEAWRSL